jgi:hypothetical protein
MAELMYYHCARLSVEVEKLNVKENAPEMPQECHRNVKEIRLLS